MYACIYLRGKKKELRHNTPAITFAHTGCLRPGFLRKRILMLSPRAVSSFERCKPRAVRVTGREAWGASLQAAAPGQATDGEAALYRDPQMPSRRLQKPRLTATRRQGASKASVTTIEFLLSLCMYCASLVAQMVKNLPALWETWV